MIERLYYHITECVDPYENLAVEEQLLLGVQPGECILYLWQNKDTVVIGRNQNAWTECRVHELEETGGHLVRRLSGGGAVWHDLGNLNFTFLVRRPDYDISKQLSVIESAVRSFGLDAQKTGRNDVTVHGRKFSGNAFYSKGDCCYHHGTVLVSSDSDKLARYLQVSKAKLAAKGVASVRSRVVNLKELAPDLTIALLRDRLIEHFGITYGLTPRPLPVDKIDPADIAVRTAHFASETWRFGSNTAFSDRAEDRFSWGGLALEYSVQNGCLQDIRLWSDGLDADFLSALPSKLEGCLFSNASLQALAENIPWEDNLQQTMVEDTIALLLSRLE